MKDKATYPVPENEEQRLGSLYDYQILDSIPEKEYDAITKIAAQICNVQASLITLLDRDRQWFKSNFGFEIRETPRALSFCNYTILDPQNLTVVPDLRNDERFSENPLVTGHPHAVFYAGAPLVTPDGMVLGSICVLDGKVNYLNDDQREALSALADQVVTKLELRKKLRELSESQQKLNGSNLRLKNFAKIVSHDMKTPIANILLMSRCVKSHKANRVDSEQTEFLVMIEESAKELLLFIDEMLIQSESIVANSNLKNPVNSAEILDQVIRFIAPQRDFEITRTGVFPMVNIDKTCMQQIFQNLLTNAIKYNNKQIGRIKIASRSDDTFHHFIFSDNGIGINERNLELVFSGESFSKTPDRFGNSGTGIGLKAVQEIVKAAGGKISVTSKISEGSEFLVSLPI